MEPQKDEKEIVVYEKTDDHVFYGEQGTRRRMPRVLRSHLPDDDYGLDNPDGSAWGRRNYRGSIFRSGTQSLSPGEYLKPGEVDFYREYH